jgi:hypothetical protein
VSCRIARDLGEHGHETRAHAIQEWRERALCTAARPNPRKESFVSHAVHADFFGATSPCQAHLVRRSVARVVVRRRAS